MGTIKLGTEMLPTKQGMFSYSIYLLVRAVTQVIAVLPLFSRQFSPKNQARPLRGQAPPTGTGPHTGTGIPITGIKCAGQPS
jgi:hypothetical protein